MKDNGEMWKVIFSLLLAIILVSPFFIFMFQRYESTCETVTVVDKRFTGEANNNPTLFVKKIDGTIVDGTTDNDTYYNVEKDDEINLCQSVGTILKANIAYYFERIER